MLISVPEFDYSFKIIGKPTALTPNTFTIQISEDLPLNKQVMLADAPSVKGPTLELSLLKPI